VAVVVVVQQQQQWVQRRWHSVSNHTLEHRALQCHLSNFLLGDFGDDNF
jgi:hypothetical protein